MSTVLIRGGKIIDGSGNPWFYGDVLVDGERIAEMLPSRLIDPERVDEVVDAAGMVVCPGFIDIQSHSIVPLMRDPRCLSKIMQGVTTEIMGEGRTPAPVGGRNTQPAPVAPEWAERAESWTRFGHWLDAVADRGVSSNIGSFLGGGTLRQYGKGMDLGDPTPEEMAVMQRVMGEAMEDGAFGVAYALIYPPDAFTSTAELVSICRVVAEYGGVYISHIRSEGERFLEALAEAIEIGRQARVPVEVYHLKATGKQNWHTMPQALAMVERARADGVDITADMYPYAASGTGLTSLFPPWAHEGGKFYENIRDPEMRARIREEALHPTGGWDSRGFWGPENIVPIGFERDHNKRYTGKPLSEIAAERGQHWVDAALDLLADEGQRIATIYFVISEDNIVLQLRHPWVKISTDAGGVDPAWATAHGPMHPRAYGTYPRVLGRYVREQGILTWEDAIRKMTWAVAARLGLRERGLLQPGVYADIVIFDPETISDRSTFENPHQISVGVRDVWVNGERVVRRGEHTGATPGKVVRGPGSS